MTITNAAIALNMPSMHGKELVARTAPEVPAGRVNDAAPAGWQEPRKRAGRRAGTQKDAEPVSCRPRASVQVGLKVRPLADFFALFACCLAGGFGAAFFAVFALSFAANSCLTFAAMASVSTL